MLFCESCTELAGWPHPDNAVAGTCGVCARVGVMHEAPDGSLTPPAVRDWFEVAPADARQIILPHPWIRGPHGEDGLPCPWPWDPPQLVGLPIGQYHCPYCESMVLAGLPHPDYGPGGGGSVVTDYVELGGLGPPDWPPPGESATVRDEYL